MEEQNQPDLMVDNRLLATKVPSPKFFRKNNLSWFLAEENQDYFPEEVISLSKGEATAFKDTAEELYQLFLDAANYAAANNLWESIGIPSTMIDLINYSLKNELSNHLIGRFDFAGGLNSNPIKLLEFNADTCSLMPETHFVQTWQYESAASKLKGAGQFNNLLLKLTAGFKDLLARYPNKEPAILLTGVGHAEDWANLDIIAEAARKAGFQEVRQMVLEKVIFAPEEGIFIEIGPENMCDTIFGLRWFPGNS